MGVYIVIPATEPAAYWLSSRETLGSLVTSMGQGARLEPGNLAIPSMRLLHAHLQWLVYSLSRSIICNTSQFLSAYLIHLKRRKDQLTPLLLRITSRVHLIPGPFKKVYFAFMQLKDKNVLLVYSCFLYVYS